MPVIRDLIYFDIEKASSLLSQFEGGLPGEVHERKEISTDQRNIRKYDIPLFKPEFGGIKSDTNSQLQTKVLHHDLIQRLEHYLFGANAGLDINHCYEECGKTIAQLHDSIKGATYLKATGWAILEDFDRLKVMASKFNKLTEFISRCSMQGLEDDPNYKALFSEIDEARAQIKNEKNRNKRVIQEKKLDKLEKTIQDKIQEQLGSDKLDDWLLEGIGFFIDYFMPGRILLTTYPFENHTDFHILANLKRDCFIDGNLDNVLQAYGNRPNLKLSVLGLITSLPIEGGHPFPDQEVDQAEVDEERAVEIGFRNMFKQMDELRKFVEYSRYPNVTIHPLAVFRELDEVDVKA